MPLTRRPGGIGILPAALYDGPMSVPVTLAELPGGSSASPAIRTSSPSAPTSQPRATSVRVEWQGRVLMTGAGNRTAENIRDNDVVVLLWPAPEPGEHALIVDGWAEVHGGAVLIQPAKAVLHVTRHCAASGLRTPRRPACR